MFSVKGFVDGENAVRYFASAAAVIAGSNTAATIAAAKHAMSSVEQPTFVIASPRKGGSINGTASKPIVHGELHFPLWIKVPTLYLFLAKSSRRCCGRRWPPKWTAIQHTYQE